MDYKIFNKIAKLNRYEKVKNKTGHIEEKLVESRRVLCWIENASAQEVYTARAVGMRPDLTFVINEKLYKDEEEVEYKGVKYSVIRHYNAYFGGIPVKKLVAEVKTGARK